MNTSATSAEGVRTPWAWLIATFFGIGKLRPGEGTWAAAVTVLLWWSAARLGLHSVIVAICATLAVTIIGTVASTRVARESGIKDPGFVVIDEVAGQMLPLIIAPLRWKYLLLSLILFRCFDILKPPPLRALELLPDGFGIMLDDVGAGLYSLVILAIALKFWPAP
ncbi:MAG TPA: phosphatidylglycerophosphatase A [Terriglobales bacterium]|nr:phosphatidylglycerophosphatase A [Terriglobales bacterium]